MTKGSAAGAAWAPALAVLPAGVGLFALVLAQSHAYWTAEAGWAWWEWLTTYRYVGPALAAASAWSVAARLRDGRREWLATTPGDGRHLRSAVWPVLLVGAALTVVAAVCVVLVAGLVVVDDHWMPAALVTGLATVTACVAVGALVARLWPHRLVAGVVGVALFCLTLGVADPIGLGRWIAVGGPVASLAGYLPAADVLATRVVIAGLLLTLALLLGTARRWAVLAPARRFGVVVLVATTVAVAYGLPALRAGSDIAPDQTAVASSCVTSGVTTVCVLPENARYAQDAAAAFDSLGSAMDDLGVDRSTALHQLSPHEMRELWSGAEPAPAEGGFVLEYGIGWIDSDDVVLHALASVIQPPQCNAVDPGEATTRMLDATPVVGWWTAQASGLPEDRLGAAAELRVDPAVVRFDAMSEAGQRTYLRDAVTALASCRFEDLPEL